MTIGDYTPRWSVTLAPELPILARFADERISFTLRLAKVTSGGEAFDRPVEIDARYRPHSTPDGLALIRDGQVVVRLAEKTPSNDWARTQALLDEKFNAIIPPEIHFHGMSPTAGGTLGKLKLLDLAEFKSTGGWLRIAYQLENSE